MTTDLHTLSGAYAVDALSDDEATLFASHLAACPSCRQEVRELREAAARMGAAEAVPPPAALKTRVLAAVDRTPQQPPKVSALDPQKRRRWVPRLAVAAAAVVIAAGAAVGIAQIGDDETAPLAGDVVQVFEADDVRTAEVDTSHGAVRVATSESRGQMAVDTSSLVELDPEQVYQLWSIADDATVSVGVLEPESGAAMPMPRPGAQVAITVEPAGGSEQPTTEPIVEVDPASV